VEKRLPLINTHLQPDLSQAEPKPQSLLPLGLGLVVLALTAFVCAGAAHLIHRGVRVISDDMMYVRTIFRFYVILIGSFVAAFLMTPALDSLVHRRRRYWKPAYTYFALATVCAFLCAFLVHFGRWQFGGFDYNILIEVGWRQLLGQRPYVDFVTSTPPGFNLGMKFAYQIFGASWDANLYLSALFACITFLWMYWLMRRLRLGRLAATLMALAVECAVMLTLCFWWYNNSTLIFASIFFLSCLLLAREGASRSAQMSFCLSLAIMVLMKPNIAGVTAVCGIALLLVLAERRILIVALTAAASLLAVLLLVGNHVSIPAMLASYHGASLERGGFSTFGFDEMNHFGKLTALVWVAVLALPLVSLAPRMAQQLQQRSWLEFALSMFFPLAVLIALYGIATNGELRDVECGVLLAAGAVLVFGMRISGSLMRRVYIAVVFAGTVGDLFLGAIRTRIYTIGSGMFFEWTDNHHRVNSGFLQNMQISSTMQHVEEQVVEAKEQNGGPYFFGPRIDFNYAVLGLPSPEHFAAWWHPGTAFARKDVPQLLEAWKQHHFQTLIFLKGDYTYYPEEFTDLIRRDYTQDDRYPEITVYHAHK